MTNAHINVNTLKKKKKKKVYKRTSFIKHNTDGAEDKSHPGFGG